MLSNYIYKCSETDKEKFKRPMDFISRGKLRGIGYTRKASSRRKKKTTSKFFNNPF